MTSTTVQTSHIMDSVIELRKRIKEVLTRVAQEIARQRLVELSGLRLSYVVSDAVQIFFLELSGKSSTEDALDVAYQKIYSDIEQLIKKGLIC